METGFKLIIAQWVHRYFSNEESIVLSFILIFTALSIGVIGHLLFPLLLGVVIAYLLHGVVKSIKPILGKKVAFWSVYGLFLSAFLSLLLLLIPVLGDQLTLLLNELPEMVQPLLLPMQHLPKQYQQYFAQEHIQQMMQQSFSHLPLIIKSAISASIESISTVFGFLIGLILFPLIVFFLLYEPKVIFQWMHRFLPKKHENLSLIWQKIDEQLSNYIRGKFLEAILVGTITYIGFWFFSLKYAALLGFLVGISVFIPYIGCIVVSVPVIMVSLFQWGLQETFWWNTIVYTVIQGLDASLLVPLIFSGTMNLHPIAIISAILFFGGLWGMWGMFFAIPLAAVVHILINDWPINHKTSVA